MDKQSKKIMAILLVLAFLIVFVPFFALRGAEFGGSDDAGSMMIEEINGG